MPFQKLIGNAARVMAAWPCLCLSAVGTIPALAGDGDIPQPMPVEATAVNAAQEEVLRAMLAEEVPARIAWAGYLIGRHRLVGLTDAVATRLQAMQADDAPTREARQALGDALVQLCTDEPAIALVSLCWERSLSSEALILASRRRDGAGELLLKLLAEDDAKPNGLRYGSHWQGACNILARANTPGLSSWLLATCTVTLRVEVHDPQERPGRYGSRGHGDGYLKRLPGFPPIVRYHSLTRRPNNGDVLLAPGPEAVYWRREEWDRGRGFGSTMLDFDRNAYRLRLLAQQLNLPDIDLGFTAAESCAVPWTTGAAMQTAVAQETTRIRDGWARLVDRLVAAQRIGGDPPPLRLRILVNDQRSEPLRTDSLPDLSALESGTPPAP